MLNRAEDLFFSQITDIGEAAIDHSEGKDRHWDESAQSLLEGFLAWEILQARREKRLPSFANVRRLLCEPDEEATYVDVYGRKQKRLIKGITFTAQKILNEAPASIAGLVSRFVRKHGLNELASIQSTADTQTQWALDPMIAADLSKRGVDFNNLRQRATTIFVMMHPLEMRKNKRLTRMILASALSALMRPGNMPTLFILDEFYASVGNLPIVKDVWSLVRGYNIQLLPILQSALQLQSLFGEEWELFASQAGLVVTLGPAVDKHTSEWMSYRSGIKTVVQASVNFGDGISEGFGASAGTGVTGGGASSNQGNNFNNGRNRSGGISYSQVAKPVVTPQEIRDIRAGHGIAWLPGMGQSCIPYYAPNYWQLDQPWVGRVKKNPLR